MPDRPVIDLEVGELIHDQAIEEMDQAEERGRRLLERRELPPHLAMEEAVDRRVRGPRWGMEL